MTAEPVQHFVEEAERAASSGEWRELPRLAGKVRDPEEQKERERRAAEWNRGRGKRVWVVRGGLQSLDPAYPTRGGNQSLGVVGEAREGDKGNLGEDGNIQYDV